VGTEASAGCPEPWGSYQASCHDCTTDGRCFLHCKCGNGRGDWYDTSYDLTKCSKLSDDGGFLACESAEKDTQDDHIHDGEDHEASTLREDPAVGTEASTGCPEPWGSYQASCHDCTIDGRCFLHCKCGNGRGDWYPSSYDLTKCSKLSDDGGFLACESAEKDAQADNNDDQDHGTDDLNEIGITLV